MPECDARPAGAARLGVRFAPARGLPEMRTKSPLRGFLAGAMIVGVPICFRRPTVVSALSAEPRRAGALTPSFQDPGMQKTLCMALVAALMAAAACDSPVSSPSRSAADAGARLNGDDTGGPIGGCSDENPCDLYQPPPGGTTPTGIMVQGTSPAQCAGTQPDVDQDGYNDDCEYRLAAAFAPKLRFDAEDGDITRESYWAVQYKPNAWPKSIITIAYLPAYHRDGGWAKLGWTRHHGDSEFIFVYLTAPYGGEFWDLHRMYTSAHWHEDWDRSEVHESYNIQWVGYPGGRPMVYVGMDKHANYNSAAKCNWNADECGAMHFNEDFLVHPSRNVGSWHHPMVDCVQSESPAYYPGTECFWNKTQRPDFRGWSGQMGGDGAGSYRNVLNYWQSRYNNM
jgi:hypothetical protein